MRLINICEDSHLKTSVNSNRFPEITRLDMFWLTDDGNSRNFRSHCGNEFGCFKRIKSSQSVFQSSFITQHTLRFMSDCRINYSQTVLLDLFKVVIIAGSLDA